MSQQTGLAERLYKRLRTPPLGRRPAGVMQLLMRMLFAVCALLALSTSVRAGSIPRQEPTVVLGTTVIRGVKSGAHVEFFGGIPFAEPPIGERRLKPPALKRKLLEYEFNASTHGPACLQQSMYASEVSEDCLTLDIYRPSGVSGPMPVLFWLYGGGFYQGSTSKYNMTNLVEQSVKRGTPVMVVASNYRLGPLGFPQGNEAQDDGVLNLGILDAKVALEWAQENIGAFGGDDSKVTVFGLSAGSIIISILMLDPDFSQLARAAILESGWAATLPLKYPTDNEDAWRSFVRGIPDCVSTIDNSTTLDCLRGLDNSSALLANINPQDAYEASLFPFGPVIDGPGGVVPDLPSTLYAQGNYTLLTTISGNVLDEGTLFVPNPNANLTTDTIVDVFIKNFSTPLIDAEVFSSSISKVVSLYLEDPSVGSPYGTGIETFGLHPGYKRIAWLVGDINFDALRRGWAQMSASAGVPTYNFIFSQRQPGYPPALGVPHGSNYAFQFGTEVPTDPALATAIMDYWLSFATSLNPNDGLGTERPAWPAWDADNEVLLQLQDDNITTIPDGYRKEQIDFVLENPLVFHH